MRREQFCFRDNENRTASAESRDVKFIGHPCVFSRARARARENTLPLAAVEGFELARILRSLRA